MSGLGAAKFPSRWNREGQRAVYTATSQALAVNELLVHLPKGAQPQGYSLLTITMNPADVVIRRSLKTSRQWFDRVGKFLAERPDDPIAFIVPSVIVPEYNVVLYPRAENFEPEFVRIESIDPFAFDPRLFEDISAAYFQ
ncbi:MAG: RES family NAD+ phosphorylase [Acidobacteriaceae bacterium]|nr:RES family NAD+ phosphorylase [Acidobacteriaceae bacterium]MBV9295288.1 RES family NAD+ phosphorylase [Acidobacteriaceae bacterium]